MRLESADSLLTARLRKSVIPSAGRVTSDFFGELLFDSKPPSNTKFDSFFFPNGVNIITGENYADYR